ncbi:hypothetical protein H2203_000585 [Taxawa tesnikishii (nom. ined.)]|nr:hypothetical protein H2203_000585 [Dothideales sp. JES 119]
MSRPLFSRASSRYEDKENNPPGMNGKHQQSLYDSHPSVTASMEDFEARAFSPSMPEFPLRDKARTSIEVQPHQTIRKPQKTAGRGRLQPGAKQPAGDKEEDGYYADDDPSGIPLPGSPEKGRSPSPSAEPEEVRTTAGAQAGGGEGVGNEHQGSDSTTWQGPDNYIRFSVRADVQHRTEPIEDAVLYVRKTYRSLTRSRYTTIVSILIALFSVTFLRVLFQDPVIGRTPDLIKVAGLARSFEPLMYYSERSHDQVMRLGESGVAVWDLTESVRSTNMTSGPIIVRELNELAKELNQLGIDLTVFFASVDGDVDSILNVMEWVQRELISLKEKTPHSSLSSAFSNLHCVLSRVGILENRHTGQPTTLGRILSDVFGQTASQITRSTLERTFMDFLGEVEAAISTELSASQALFNHFEIIDRQFLNLQRTVIRETDKQEREEDELLSSLWTRLVGGNQNARRKFEKNKQLLASLREQTVSNKHVLVEHNSHLMRVRSDLEVLRKKLVSPLVRANDSSTLTVEEQIRGLEGIYVTLQATREQQKGRLGERIHEAANPRRTHIVGGEGHGIEGR